MGFGCHISHFFRTISLLVAHIFRFTVFGELLIILENEVKTLIKSLEFQLTSVIAKDGTGRLSGKNYYSQHFATFTKIQYISQKSIRFCNDSLHFIENNFWQEFATYEVRTEGRKDWLERRKVGKGVNVHI